MRELRCAVQYRQDDTRESPGLLVATLLNYGERAGDREEVFLDGALSWPENGIVITIQHDRRSPVMRALPVLEGRAVKISQRFPNTQIGRDSAENVRNGLFTGMSIEFRAQEETYVGTERRISKARLFGASIVDEASYQGSTIDVRERRKSAGMAWRPWW